VQQLRRISLGIIWKPYFLLHLKSSQKLPVLANVRKLQLRIGNSPFQLTLTKDGKATRS
jgi:hypothetical protein